MSSAYPVPAAQQEALFEVKKSRFIAMAAHAASRDAALQFVESVRHRYPDARHHCWAYLLGDPGGSCEAGMNDDGEPAGTAGKPILNVLQHKGVGDVVLVVVRYFGGIKLGAGGLTRAYSSSAEAVMSSLAVLERQPLIERRLRLDFSQEQALRHWAGQHEAQLCELSYGEGVAVRLSLPQEQEAALEAFCRGAGIHCASS